MATPYVDTFDKAVARTTPVTGVKAVTPADGTDLPNGPCRGLMATVAGNIAVYTKDGDEVTLPVNANTIYPFSVGRVLSTGTTATGIFALY